MYEQTSRSVTRPITLSGRHTLKVRYGETDQMGVVYHANYLVWFHEARDALLGGAGIDIARLERDGYRFPLVDACCRYLRPAHYGDDIAIDAHMSFETVARMQCRFEVRNARTRRLLSVGSSLSVVTDARGKVLLRLPETIVARVAAAITDAPSRPLAVWRRHD
jgi:acyl-CoA thioester hydrolase